MNSPLFWRIFLAHVAADFALQPDALILAKRKVWGIAVHAGIFGATMAVTLRDYLDSQTILIAIVALCVFHFAVDLAKGRLQSFMNRDSLWVFLGDQTLHLGSIFLVSYLLRFRVIQEQPAFLPLSLAIIAVWGGAIVFETFRAEIRGKHLGPFSALGSRQGHLAMVENAALFAIGLQFGWFILGLLILLPRIAGWFNGKKLGIVPYCWILAFSLGLVSRAVVLRG